MTRRRDKVNGLLRQEIGELLLHGMQDPRLACLVSVTRVSTSLDLRHAEVSVSVMGSQEEKEKVMQGLRSAVSYIRRELAGHLTFKFVPQLRFALDVSMEEGDRVLHLMDDLSRGEAEEANEKQD